MLRPIYKKKSKHQVRNYRYKLYERHILNSLIPSANNFLSVFISACRQTYSSNHLLTRLIENWKQSLKNKFLGAVQIARIVIYGFDLNSLKFFY